MSSPRWSNRRTFVPLVLLDDMGLERTWIARLVFVSIPLAAALCALAQRWGSTPIAPVIGLITLALAPFVVGVAGFDVGLVFGVIMVDLAVFGLLHGSAMPFDIAPFLLLAVLASVGLSASLFTGLVCLAAGIAVPATLELTNGFTGSFTWAIGMTAAWAAAFGVQSLLSLVRELTETQRDLAERAATDERRRIAAELHDVIAHSLAVTMLHITGARLALTTDDRAEAIEALAEAERSGRASLTDVRRSVGLLAEGGGQATALPNAAAVPTLVDDFRSAGLRVAFNVDGDLDEIPTAIGLALYRVTQESLSNVARHAPGEDARVCITVEHQRVTLTLRNEASVDSLTRLGDGHGLSGMAERVGALGGTFCAGPSDDAWIVTATMPR